ncbi:hypothetical protein ABK040_015511 [Willaertia magna]
MSSERVWLVIGTSSGIGKEIVKAVLNRGDKVIATARRLSSIEDLKQIGANILQLDVTSEVSVINSVVEQAIKIYGHVDVLVNNAAFVINGTIEETSAEDTQRIFNTNVYGTLNVTRAILPHFRSRKSGLIINISSLAGTQGFKVCGLYCATKFAIEGISEALRDEVKDLGIKVLVVEPGFFRTELNSTNNLVDAKRTVSDYDQLYNEFNLHEIHQKQAGDPKKLAERLFEVVTQTGIAEGKEIPFRLPIGEDAFPFAINNYERKLKETKEVEELTKGTNFDQ